MPSPDTVANAIVLAAAGIGAILVIFCVVRIVRHRAAESDSTRLTERGSG